MKSVSVFCGSSAGDDPGYMDAARLLGRALATNEITLIYGGANVGLMGALADSVLENKGKVIGVMPRFLQGKEMVHTALTELIICETMHERKNKMFELSEGFLALPGGFGTLEEIIEVLTWQQLDLHKYPVGFLNVNGFYDHLKMFFSEMERTKLLKPEYRSMALFSNNIVDMLGLMKSYKKADGDKWIGKSFT
jgi:uncharacterized protein (TIGR00730 family)